MKSDQKSKSNLPNPTARIIGRFTDLYFDKFDVKPKIQGPWCGKLIKGLLADHSPDGIIRVIELYFDDPLNKNRVFHLPNILSGWSFNRYLPKIKYNPAFYENADELNKNIW